jgi:hypothetical protein
MSAKVQQGHHFQPLVLHRVHHRGGEEFFLGFEVVVRRGFRSAHPRGNFAMLARS